METIISACISAGVTLLICLITQRYQSSKDRALLEYKLEELTKKVEKHNSLIERTYQLEQRTEVQDEQIKNVNQRVDKLEEKEGA